MATYAAFKHVELYNVGKTKKRVLRPPGGGSSDIFGSDVPSTPRSVKNHMQSNIFSCEKGSVKNNCDQPRRGQKNVDSYTRLFGDPERPFTPAKNHMKSSIPFGGTPKPENRNDNSAANGNGTHSNSSKNGKSANGGSSSSASSVSSSTENLKMNGLSKTEIEENSINSSDEKIGTKDSLSARSSTSKVSEKANGEVSSIKPNASSNSEDTSSEVTSSTLSSQKTTSASSGSQKSTPRNPITGCGLGNDQRTRRTVNRKETEEPSAVGGEKTAPTECKNEKDEKSEAHVESSAMNSQQQLPVETQNDRSPNLNEEKNIEDDVKSQVSVNTLVSQNTASIADGTKKLTPRNPITGCGLGEYGQIFRRNNRRDGNPVTGEGYKPAVGEINTTIPSLNGANQVINKNRVPPGGFSSGLW